MLIIYHLLTTFIVVVSFPFILLKEGKSRFQQRLGLNLSNLGDPRNGRVWVHALSVGEVLSAIPLLEVLRNRHPSREIVLTVKTATGLEVAREKLGKNVDYLMPMPLDFWWATRRLIHRVKPTVFILVETDIWPGQISSLRRRGIKAILVNGRVSPRTARAYERWRFLAKRILALFELLLMQTELDRSRVLTAGVGPDKVRVTGNIKFDGKWSPVGKEERQRWLRVFGLKSGLTWVAGSTHNPEERIIFNVFQRLLKAFSDLFLIVCPREVHRFEEVYRLAREYGFKVARRTELSVYHEKYDVVILNTIGELSNIYALADVAFVGGSLTRFGGHNLLEPASFGIPVIFGAHTFNFDAMSRAMVDCGGGRRVNSETELFDVMSELLGKQNRREAMGRSAKAFVAQNQGAVDTVMEILEPCLTAHRSNTSDEVH